MRFLLVAAAFLALSSPTLAQAPDAQAASVEVIDGFDDLMSGARAEMARGEMVQAEGLFRRALALAQAQGGLEHAYTTSAMSGLAIALSGQRRSEEAISLFRAVVDIRRRTLSERDPNLPDAIDNLAFALSTRSQNLAQRETETLFREALTLRRTASDRTPLPRALLRLAETLLLVGRPAEAEVLLREADAILVELGAEPRDRAYLRVRMSPILLALYRYEDAEAINRETLDLVGGNDGTPDGIRAFGLGGLGQALLAQGRLEEAEAPLMASRSMLEAIQPGGADLATIYSSLARLREAQGQYIEARALADQALVLARALFAPADPALVNYLMAVTATAFRTGDLDAAESHAREVLEIDLGELHPTRASQLMNLANILEMRARYDDAQALYREALTVGRATLPPGDPQFASLTSGLASVLFLQGGADLEALVLLQEAVTVIQARPEYSAADASRVLMKMARVLRRMGNLDAAESAMRSALEVRTLELGARHPDVAASLDAMAELALARGEYAQAEVLSLQSLEIAKEALADAHPDQIGPRLHLGLALLGQGNEDDAGNWMTDSLGRLSRQHCGSPTSERPEMAPADCRGHPDLTIALAQIALFRAVFVDRPISATRAMERAGRMVLDRTRLRYRAEPNARQEFSAFAARHGEFVSLAWATIDPSARAEMVPELTARFWSGWGMGTP